MSTVGALVDRMFRDYLANPSDTPVQVSLASQVTDVATTAIYSAGELMAEEIASLGPGTVIELGLEMARVTAHDEDSRTLTITRGLYGSTAATHAAGTLMRVAPKWPRRVVFDAIADEIVGLYPSVYAVGQAWAHSSELVTTIEDAAAVGLLDARQLIAGHYETIPAELVHVDDVATGIAVQFTPRYDVAGDVWIRYSKSFPRPTSESETLASLGVDPSWDRILLFGALMSLILQSDIDAATQEFVTEALENQGFPPTSGAQLAVTLARLRQTQLVQAATRLRATNRVSTVYQREL